MDVVIFYFKIKDTGSFYLKKRFYLWRSFKSRVHSNLWHISVADVFIAVPYTVN